jgi:AraC family transcriptional regulator
LVPSLNPSFSDGTVRQERLFRLNRAINYILTRYAEELNLTKLAGIACFSKYHFHRLFRTFVGETLNDFVRRTRLEKAISRLMLDKHKSITEVAFDCGFSSSQNFAKTFKSYFGITPTFIRERYSWETIKRDIENRELLRGPSPAYFQSSDLDKPFHGHFLRRINRMTEGRKPILIRVSDIPSLRMAYIRRIGPYRPEMIAPVFTRLLQWAVPRGFWDKNSLLIGTIWNNPGITSEEKCICDACITLPESVRTAEGINIQILPGGKFAIYHCQIEPHDFPEAWRRLIFEWLIFSDYQPDDRPSYVVYYDGGSPSFKPWIVDLCLAIKPL